MEKNLWIYKYAHEDEWKYATDNSRSPNLGGRERGGQKLTQSSLLRRFLEPWDTISGQKELIREIQKWRIQKSNLPPMSSPVRMQRPNTVRQRVQLEECAVPPSSSNEGNLGVKRGLISDPLSRRISIGHRDLGVRHASGRHPGPERGLYIPSISIGTLVLTGIWRGWNRDSKNILHLITQITIILNEVVNDVIYTK